MKKFKSTMKVLMVTLILFLALQTGVSADQTLNASTDPGTMACQINLTGAHSGDTFDVYKFVDVNFNATTNVVSYTFTTAAQAFIDGSSYAGLTMNTFQNYSENQLQKFLAKYAVYVIQQGTPSAVSGTAGSDGKAYMSVTGAGQYMILGAGNNSGAYVYQIQTASFLPDSSYSVTTAANLDVKSSTPSITKSVSDADQQVSYGDTITYSVNVAVPTYAVDATNTTFTVKDQLPAGIVYTGDYTVKVYNGSTLLATLSTTNNDFYTSIGNYTNSSPTWTFNYEKIRQYAGKSIVITYDAFVNKGTTYGVGLLTLGAANTNTATLSYSTKPFASSDTLQTLTSTASIYTYGIQIKKVDASDENKVLNGVEFNVYKGSVDAANLVGTLTTDSTGYATLAGLDVGTYVLHETKAATGYVLPSSDTTITITDVDKDGLVDANQSAVTTLTGYKAYTYAEITNNTGLFSLPSTGGIGTWVFTIVGIAVMIAAALVLFMSAKKKRTNN